jgi:hypothetical protein
VNACSRCVHPFVGHDVKIIRDVELLIMCTRCLCRYAVRLKPRFDWFLGGAK